MSSAFTNPTSAPPGQVAPIGQFIDGRWRASGNRFEVRGPQGGVPTCVALAATEADVADAVAAAVGARASAALPGHARAALLRRAQANVEVRADEFARAITRETGKPIKDARVEVRRSLETLGFCAEEAIRIEGQHIPLDGSELGAGKVAMMLRFPVGVVGAIVPFNAPLSMACHKVGPAVAAGNALVFKAPPEAPSAIAMLADAFAAAGIAPGAFNVLNGHAGVGAAMVADPRVDFITFTGSTRAGLAVRAAAGLRRSTLELGGLGPNIVHADADVDHAAPLCAVNGTRLAGQSCVSVQNLFVHRSLLERFVPILVERLSAMKLGDPMDPDTDVGPMINVAAAERVEAWVEEARAGGATVLCGARREGAWYAPTALVGTTPQMKVVCQEIFGPVIVVRPYDELQEPIDWINASGMGLNCGLFTQSVPVLLRAVRSIRCGGIIANATSSFRPDQTPYGGVGLSGAGREGPQRAVRDMTEERMVILNW